jgi:hypothetical protein
MTISAMPCTSSGCSAAVSWAAAGIANAVVDNSAKVSLFIGIELECFAMESPSPEFRTFHDFALAALFV